jgi:ATP-dependent DNA helicase Q1
MESLIVQMLVLRYLEEAFSSTAYTVNVYVAPGNQALRLTRFTREDIVNGGGPRIQCSFRRHGRKVKSKKTTFDRQSPDILDLQEDATAGPSQIRKPAPPRKKRLYEDVSDPDEVDGEDFTSQIMMIDAEESDVDDGDDADWVYSFRPPQPTKKRRKSEGKAKGIPAGLNRRTSGDEHEVISLSSD